MLPIVILRPEPGASETARRAAALGLMVRTVPLFRIESRPWTVPDLTQHDVLLLTSANAVRHAGPGLAMLADLPAYAVGGTTAKAAEAAGLTVAATGERDAQAMVDAMTSCDPRRILWLAGEQRSALDPGAARITAISCYAARAVADPPGWAEAVAGPAVLLAHSARAAGRAAALAGAARAHLHLAAISPAAAAAAGDGWAATAAAPQPTDTDLLALAARLCQSHG
jgi:uroporphyrinogen-III synthase